MQQENGAQVAVPMVAGNRGYALGLLLLLYLSNYLDRQILAILLEPIKLDLGLSDAQLGFLSGIAFAIFFATLGIPIAMWADRTSRRNVVVVALAAWSGMTMLCGFAVNFWQLVLARIGVAVGEAGGAPPAHSMISDLYAPHERATAMAVYSLGAPFGIFCGFLIGGWVNVENGWRAAFFVVGAPGLLLALVIRFTLREPRRGAADGLQDTAPAPPLAEVLRFIWGQRSLVHMLAAATLTALAGYGAIIWQPVFLIRSFGLETDEVGLALALIIGIGGSIGTYFGGLMADRLGQRDARWYVWVIAGAAVLSAPFLAGA
ncbi:MAG: MFS transporter [Rhodospirillaceae bacterium]